MKTCNHLWKGGLWIALLMLTVGWTVAEAQITLTVPSVSAIPGSQVLIPVNIGNVDVTNNVGSYEFEMTCDSTIIRFTGAEAAGTLCAGAAPTVNYTVAPRGPGRIKVVWSSTTSIVSNGILIYVKATAQSKIGSTNLELINVFAWKLATPPPALTVTVTNGSLRTNRAPTMSPVPAKTVAEKDTLKFTASGTDPDLPSDALSYSLSGAPTGASIVASTGAFTWVPDYGQAGSYSFRIKVTDLGGASDSTTVTVTVTKTNRRPSFTTKMPDTTIGDNKEFAFTYAGTDPDAGTTLTFKLESGPTGATVSSSTGVFSWTPTVGQTGAFNVVVSVSEGALADTAKSKITVTHVNRAPSFVTKLRDTTVNEGTTLTFAYTATDPDAGTTLQYGMTNAPSGASITTAGALTFVVPSNPQRTYILAVFASDGSLADTAKATVTVNRKPVFTSKTPASATTVSRNIATTFTVVATDPDGDALTFSWKINGVAEAATGNSLTKTFTDAHSTPKTVAAVFADPRGLKDSTSWSFTITPVEDAEVIPTEFALGQNYPNPFNPSTSIRFDLPKQSPVVLEIYDVLGVRIRTMLGGQTINAGRHHIVWDGRDELGAIMPSGTYLYRISAGDFSSTRRMMLLK